MSTVGSAKWSSQEASATIVWPSDATAEVGEIETG